MRYMFHKRNVYYLATSFQRLEQYHFYEWPVTAMVSQTVIHIPTVLVHMMATHTGCVILLVCSKSDGTRSFHLLLPARSKPKLRKTEVSGLQLRRRNKKWQNYKLSGLHTGSNIFKLQLHSCILSNFDTIKVIIVSKKKQRRRNGGGAQLS